MIKRNNLIKIICIALVIFTSASLLCSCTESTAVMKMKNYKISEGMYSYWMSYYKTAVLETYGGTDSDEFWSEYIGEGKTAEKYVNENVEKYVKELLVGEYLFDIYKLSLSDELISSIDCDISEKSEYYGGSDDFSEALKEYGIDSKVLREIYLTEEKNNAVKEYLFGSGGVYSADDNELAKYYEENYNCIKVIPIYTKIKLIYDEKGNVLYDESGNVKYYTLDEQQESERLQHIYDICVLIESGEDIDSLAKEFSETDMSAYDSGILLSANEYTTYGYELLNSASTLDIGEYTIIEDGYISYIIYKKELPEFGKLSQKDTAQLSGMKNYCELEKYSKLISEYEDEIIVYDAIKNYSASSAPKMKSNL